MKKILAVILFVFTACNLSEDKTNNQGPGDTGAYKFEDWISGTWAVIPARGTGSFTVSRKTGSINAVYTSTEGKEFQLEGVLYSTVSKTEAVYKKGSEDYYFAVSIKEDGKRMYVGKSAYKDMALVLFTSSAIEYFADRSGGSSGGGSGGGGEETPPDRLPSEFEEAFLRNLKLPYGYRNGDYYFKAEDNGDFVFHDITKGTPYLFFTAKSPTSALYRNQSKSQYYMFEIDSSGNLKRSAPSGTQNTGNTTIFALRDTAEFDRLFTDSLAGRYNSPIGETGYQENRIFTADTTGSFRIANDPYQLVRVVSKTQAVYKRFNLYYGLNASSGRIWLTVFTNGTNSANEVNFSNYVVLATRYSGGEADTPNRLTGATDRDKYLQNVSGKSFNYSNGETRGYFKIEASGNFGEQSFYPGNFYNNPHFYSLRSYALSSVLSPISARYNSTISIVIDPLGGLSVRNHPNFSYNIYGSTIRDYETEYRNNAPGTGDKSELIVKGESYLLIRVIHPDAAIYQKLSDGKYYGIQIDRGNAIVRTKGFNSPDAVTMD